MTYLGVDTCAQITAQQAHSLRENGVSFVCRYLVPEGYSKGVTAAEILTLRGAGLAILFCWETSASAMSKGAAQGVQDGARARQLAEKFGLPSGTAIYFAADYDVPQRDLIQGEQYILAAQSALGKYVAGIYGGQRVCEFLRDRGTTSKIWQCVAWTNVFLPDASVRQYAWQGADESKAMAAATGILAVDMDATEDMRKAGMWMPYTEYEDGDGTIVEPIADPWYVKNGTQTWVEKEGIASGGRPNDYATRAEVWQMIRNYNRRFESEDTKSDSGLLS